MTEQLSLPIEPQDHDAGCWIYHKLDLRTGKHIETHTWPNMSTWGYMRDLVHKGNETYVKTNSHFRWVCNGEKRKG